MTQEVRAVHCVTASVATTRFELLARGRASLDKAKESGEFYPLRGLLDEMQARLDERMSAHRRAQRITAAMP